MTGGEPPEGAAGRAREDAASTAWQEGRAAGQAPAERRLLATIAAGRSARMQRALVLVMSTMSALVLLAAGSGWLLASYVSDHLTRLDAGTSGTPASGPLNILLAGVDVRSGLTRHQQFLLHVGHVASHNSDTLIIVHVSADHRHVEAISVPRDSWVRIPGYGMNKINAAIGLGGPKLMVRTVEELTGLTINDYVEVNFLGFVKVIDALGGVNICLPYAVDDPYTGLHLSAGRHHVNGIRALQFARDRHSFPLSDLSRISDQQQLLASVLTEAVSSGTLTDPLRFARFLAAITSAIRVDQGFDVVSLARQLRFVRPNDVTFVTVPLANTSYLTPTGQSAVLWNWQAARTLFAQIASDRLVRHRRARTRRAGQPARGASSPGNRPKTAAQAACR
ncbi:MAG TPA: LCP family protein [Streptosporangiaceae bacterium]|nr:LCP family protein [Streptosporangiaceae bacterium]